MLKIPCYQDTHLPLIRNRFSVEKPDHFQIPSNCTRTKVAGNTLHCAFSSAACHGGTRGTRWVIYSPPPPPQTQGHGGDRGMLHPQEHPAVCLSTYTAAPGAMLSGWGRRSITSGGEASHLDGKTPGANPAEQHQRERKILGCFYF